MDSDSVNSVRSKEFDINEEVYGIKFERTPLQEEIDSTRREMIRNIREHCKKGKESRE
jgi:hypothetical protein